MVGYSISISWDWVILYKIREAFNVLYQIGDNIGNGFNGKLKAEDTLNWFVWLVVCGWILNLNIVGLMIFFLFFSPTTTTTKTYQSSNWRILYTRGDIFNGWY